MTDDGTSRQRLPVLLLQSSRQTQGENKEKFKKQVKSTKKFDRAGLGVANRFMEHTRF